MRLLVTNIPDVTDTNVIESKMILSENIIRNVYPLFDEVLSSKIQRSQELEGKLATARKQVLKKKNTLEQLMTEYKRKQKESKLLARVDKLVQAGLIYDGTLKNEIIILLRIVDKLPEDKLDYHLKKTLNIIHKRFQQWVSFLKFEKLTHSPLIL